MKQLLGTAITLTAIGVAVRVIHEVHKLNHKVDKLDDRLTRTQNKKSTPRSSGIFPEVRDMSVSI